MIYFIKNCIYTLFIIIVILIFIFILCLFIQLFIKFILYSNIKFI